MAALITIDSLSAHGLSPEALAVWRARGVEHLLPLQAHAVANSGVLQGQSVIVFAPTSSGKTLIAELAAMRHIEGRRRVVFLVPTKALAEERGTEFAHRFGALGIRVAVATRERPQTDVTVMEGDWDLLVAVYEKMRAFMVARPAMLAEVGLVVADEMQLIGEMGRGDSVELILTKLRRAPYGDVQFLGLSAVLADAERLGAWLECNVVTWDGRPVELREGVVCAEDGMFRYHGINRGEIGCEPLLDMSVFPVEFDGDKPAAPMLALATQLVMRGESALIFAPTKRLTREWAMVLADSLDLPPAEETLAMLAALEPSQGRRMLEHLFQHGVGLHTADLPWALRRAVEHAYDAGEVRALVATSTLAQGVNLSGRNVLVAPEQIQTDRWTGEPLAVALSRSRFHNAGGRAGRFGREADFGRAILVARTRAEADRLWRHYIAQPPETLRPGLLSADLAPLMLDLIATGVADRPRQIENFLLATHTGRTHWSELPPPDWLDLWHGALERVERAGLAQRSDGGDLEITGLGHEAARAGTALATVRQMTAWLQAIEDEPQLLEAILCACRTPDGADCPLPLGAGERRSRALPEAMAEALGTPTNPISLGWLLPERGTTPSDLAAMKKSLLLWAWLSDEPTDAIEEAHGIHAGMIENLAGHIAWLVETLANLATALGHSDDRTGRWHSLAQRLPHGLPEGAEGWTSAHLTGVGRTHVRALMREGFTRPEDLDGISMEMLGAIIPPPLAQALLMGSAPTSPRAVNRPIGKPASEPASDDPVTLPTVDPETGTVRWLGRETRLTPKPARLLALLAARAPEAVGYREIEDTVWLPGEAAERQQISAHLRRVVRALSEIDATRAQEMFEVRPGQGLRMRVTPR